MNHYYQSSDTPFASEYRELLGFSVDAHAANDMIFSSTIQDDIINNSSPAVVVILQKIIDTRLPKIISVGMSNDNVHQGFKNWPKQRSTYPYNYHLSYYKALFAVNGDHPF